MVLRARGPGWFCQKLARSWGLKEGEGLGRPSRGHFRGMDGPAAIMRSLPGWESSVGLLGGQSVHGPHPTLSSLTWASRPRLSLFSQYL